MFQDDGTLCVIGLHANVIRYAAILNTTGGQFCLKITHFINKVGDLINLRDL